MTMNNRSFYQTILDQTDAELWQAQARIQPDGMVAVDQEIVQARFMVDAAGWRTTPDSISILELLRNKPG